MPVDFEPLPRNAQQLRSRREEFARLMLLTDSALDREIRLQAILHPRTFHSDLQRLAEKAGRPHTSLYALNGDYLVTVKSFFFASIEAKSAHLTELLGSLREQFCDLLNYCQNKAQILAALRNIADHILPLERMPDDAVRIIEEYAPELLTIVGHLLDVNVVPIWLFVRLLKLGLDRLCPCCPQCGGSGQVNYARCSTCGGTGQR